MKLLAYVIPLLLVSFAAQATTQIDVSIYETSEGAITAYWNGQALTTTSMGNETWDVNLASAGHNLDIALLGEQISWFEPDNGLFNVVTVLSSTDLLFQSETAFAGVGPFGYGVSWIIGVDFTSDQEAFAQVFDGPASVPDGGSTLGLIGLGLAGLGLLKSKFKSARK